MKIRDEKENTTIATLNQVEVIYCQPLGQDKDNSLKSNLNCHKWIQEFTKEFTNSLNKFIRTGSCRILKCDYIFQVQKLLLMQDVSSSGRENFLNSQIFYKSLNIVETDDIYLLLKQELAVLSANGRLFLWDLHTFKPVYDKKLRYQLENVCMTISCDYSLYAVGSQSHISFVDPKSADPIASIESRERGSGKLRWNLHFFEMNVKSSHVLFPATHIP